MTERCPFCLEDIQSGLQRCERCGEPLTAEAEQRLAPVAVVERARAIRKARAKAREALKAAIVSPFCCWIVLAPVAIAYGMEARRICRENDAEPPGTALAAIIIGIIVLLLCGVLTVGNQALQQM